MVKKSKHFTFYERSRSDFYLLPSLKMHPSKNKQTISLSLQGFLCPEAPVPFSANAVVHLSSASVNLHFNLFLVFSPPAELGVCLQRGPDYAHLRGGAMKGDSNGETISREIGRCSCLIFLSAAAAQSYAP